MIISPKRCPECNAKKVYPYTRILLKDDIAILGFQCESCGWHSGVEEDKKVFNDWVKEWSE